MKYDLIIIGSGPAGYVAAIRAGQLGLKTALIEKYKIGGMCLNWGCIPTKALLESAGKFAGLKDLKSFGIDGIDAKAATFNYKKAFDRAKRIVKRLTGGVEFLLKKNNVEIIIGEASVSSANTVSVDNRLLETNHIMLATGTKSGTLDAPIPEDLLLDVKDFLEGSDVPENPVVIGNGGQALEFAQFFQMTDKNVTLLVPDSAILPEIDKTLIKFFETKFKKSKINIVYEAKIESYADGVLKVNGQDIPCDGIINATKRSALLPPSEVTIVTENGYVKTDEKFRTNIPTIFAAGDMNGKRMFAHAASAQGLNIVETINGIDKTISFDKTPYYMYTSPEMAQIGETEDALKEAGVDYKISDFAISANGKAMTEGNTEGFVRVLSETKYGEVLGVQIIAPHATDMISEASAIMELEGTVFDMAKIVHAHPTVSEIVMEAGYDAFDQPIHK